MNGQIIVKADRAGGEEETKMTNRGGCGRGRQGRGRGRESDTQSSWNSQNNQNRQSTRSYTQEEWQNMSYSDRNWVIRERERVQTARMVASML
jgi:hypothetical protein